MIDLLSRIGTIVCSRLLQQSRAAVYLFCAIDKALMSKILSKI